MQPNPPSLAFTWLGRGAGCVGRAGAWPASAPADVLAQLLHLLQGEINWWGDSRKCRRRTFEREVKQ
jgi:hypothetical protein